MKWLEAAQNLPTGHKTRLNCECGDGKTLIVNHNAQGYSCHCFRCDINAFQGKGQQTLAELNRVKELNAAAATINLKLELPHDYTTEVPLQGRLWLYAGGITEATWRKYRIGYSPSLDRVVLPVWDTSNKLVWYQCRALHNGQNPKYIQPSRGRDNILFQVSPSLKSSEFAIIVEDILSAIRVGKHVCAYSLLGTKITTKQATILGRYGTVALWLDPDNAGRKGSYAIRKTLGLITEVKTISTDKDPKELSDQQIKQVIKDALKTH